MTNITLTINGRAISAAVEPRLNLADFIREHQTLTATHVGCEHGVCGACTVWIDGAPARSCITFAAAAGGAEITTLEGFENDLVMQSLREAFAEHHGLQCGFCTPGMLMTARDILTRLPEADEKRIRLELSGNLCRCTGYVGIVRAVLAAQAALRTNGYARPAQQRKIGPVGAHPSTVQGDAVRRVRTSGTSASPTRPILETIDAIDWSAVERDGVELRQTFVVPFPTAQVWQFFADLDQVARCMPGAHLLKPESNGRADGEINIKLGPITSAFRGVLDVTRDDANQRGTVRGAGRDAQSPSSAQAIITYTVAPATAEGSKVDVAVKFLLSGPLAQFSRSGLIKDVADHLTRIFAQNLEARLSGRTSTTDTAKALDAGAVARSALWSRVKGLFRRRTPA